MKTILSALASGLFLAGAASAAPITAAFDSDAEGFTGNGHTVVWTATGGNPDGYIRVTDTQGGIGSIDAGASLIKPLMVGGQISFDAILFSASGDDFDGFGEITLSGGGFTATADAAVGIPSIGSWTTYATDLTAATWGLADADFATMLANLDGISLVTETTVGVNEVLGIDNFTVDSAVPVPAAALLFAPFAAAAARRRRS